jgi:hypothetical protein
LNIQQTTCCLNGNQQADPLCFLPPMCWSVVEAREVFELPLLRTVLSGPDGHRRNGSRFAPDGTTPYSPLRGKNTVGGCQSSF